jgi:hypothetical protein
LENQDIEEEESLEHPSERVIQLLLDQINYLKSELQYYRDEFVRMQEICLSRENTIETVQEPDYTEPNMVPIRGTLTPSAKRAELERLYRARARENKVSSGT